MSIYTDLITEDTAPEFNHVMRAKSDLMEIWNTAPNDSIEFWELALDYYRATLEHREICPSSGGEIFDYCEHNLKAMGWLDNEDDNSDLDCFGII